MAKRSLCHAVRRFFHHPGCGGIGLRKTPGFCLSASAASGRMAHPCSAMLSISPLRLQHCEKRRRNFLPAFTVRRKSSPIVKPLRLQRIPRASGLRVRPHSPSGLRCGWKLCKSSACNPNFRCAHGDAEWIKSLHGFRRCRWIKRHRVCHRIFRSAAGVRNN